MTSTPDDQARIAEAEAAQARMLAALPDFPQFGFWVHTGLAGYGPDLEPDDYPARSWEAVASQIAWELNSAADFQAEGMSATADIARTAYDDARVSAGPDAWRAVAEWYHTADEARRLADELGTLSMSFNNLSDADNPAPLYQGQPELRHARIWDLIERHFPLGISDNSRLYVWICEEDPGDEPE
jgi:hypothetical protein